MQGARGGASQTEGASLKPRGGHMLWQPRGTEKEGDDSRMRVEREFLFSLCFFQWRLYGRGGGMRRQEEHVWRA